mmetsp:Transcript_45118/g.107287  ORF Transcript_45118/g.107287 Transcript_45118/m.107287 type:complete len:237 (-) Transcript_45118:8-718(-)
MPCSTSRDNVGSRSRGASASGDHSIRRPDSVALRAHSPSNSAQSFCTSCKTAATCLYFVVLGSMGFPTASPMYLERMARHLSSFLAADAASCPCKIPSGSTNSTFVYKWAFFPSTGGAKSARGIVTCRSMFTFLAVENIHAHDALSALSVCLASGLSPCALGWSSCSISSTTQLSSCTAGFTSKVFTSITEIFTGGSGGGFFLELAELAPPPIAIKLKLADHARNFYLLCLAKGYA